MKRNLEHEGCQVRRYGPAPAFDLRCFKGDSSSQANPVTNNNQVAVQGGGTATGAATSSGKGSSAAAGGSTSVIATASGKNNTTNITTTTNYTTSDPDVVESALAAETATATNAIAANTALNAGTTAAFSQALTNFGTLVSQTVSSLTQTAPQAVQLQQAAPGPTIIYAGAGSTGATSASSSPDSTPQATSDQVAPVSASAPGGLSTEEWIAIGTLAVGAIGVILLLRK
jgi:hypothetical protein